MHAVAVLLACLSCTSQGFRAHLAEGGAQANSRDRHESVPEASDTVSRNVALAESKQSQSKRRMTPLKELAMLLAEGGPQANSGDRHESVQKASDTVSRTVPVSKSKLSRSKRRKSVRMTPLKVLAMLLLAANPTAGWQVTAHGGRSTMNNPSGMNLGIPRSVGVRATRVLNSQGTLHSNMQSQGILHDADQRTPRSWRHGGTRMAMTTPMADDDFEAALSFLATSGELSESRKRVLLLESLMSDAIDEEDYSAAARLRDEARELRSKDPALLSSILRRDMKAAVKGNQFEEAAKYRDQLRTIQQFLPEYRLTGMWRGSFPGQGDIFVRILYAGDTLQAMKLDGETAFRADVSEPQNGGNDITMAMTHDGLQSPYWQKDSEHFVGEGVVQGGASIPGQMYVLDEGIIGFLWRGGGGVGDEETRDGEPVLAGAVLDRGGGGRPPDRNADILVVFKRDYEAEVGDHTSFA